LYTFKNAGTRKRRIMKSRILGIVLMTLASLCFVVSFVVIILTSDASRYLFYLQLICGLAFLIVAWRSMIPAKRKKGEEEKK